LPGKRKKRIASIAILTIIIAVISVFLWFRNHRKEVSQDLFLQLPNDADIAVVDLMALNKLLKTDKTLFYKDSTSSKGLMSFVESPLEMGLDLSINPIAFKRREVTSFQIAFALNNSSAFKSWLVDGPGAKWTYSVNNMGGFEIFKFNEKPYCFAFDQNSLLFISDTTFSDDIATDFFTGTHGEIPINSFTPAENAIVSIRFHSTYSIQIGGFMPLNLDGQVDVYLDDSTLLLQTPQYQAAKHSFTTFSQTLNEESVQSKALAPLRDFWHLTDKDAACLRGNWKLDWHGSATRSLDYISYDFDDFFNRIEVRKTVEEHYPDIGGAFHPKNIDGGLKWFNHLKKHGLIRNDSVKIGTFWYPFLQNEEIFYFGRRPDTTVQENIFASTYIHFSSLILDFEQIGIPFPIGDTTIANSLNELYMSNEMKQLQLELSCKANNPHHILAFTLHFINAAIQE